MTAKSLAAMAAAAFLLAAGWPVQAQNKAEIKLFNTVKIKKDSKSIQKFLARFPQSVYAPAVRQMQDSILFFALRPDDVTAYMDFAAQHPASRYTAAAYAKIDALNTSRLSDAEALDIAHEVLDRETAVLAAKGLKSLNQEHVIVLTPFQDGKYGIITLKENSGKWEIAGKLSEQIYTNDYSLKETRLAGSVMPVSIKGEQHLFFCYANGSSEISAGHMQNNNTEYIANLYSLKDGSVYNAIFSGRRIIDPQSGKCLPQDHDIWGSCLDASQGGALSTPQMTWLLEHMAAQPHLKPYDKNLFTSQESIEWWYSANPARSGSIQFGILPAGCGLVQAYDACPNKERAGEYDVKVFDLYNNTLVMTYHRTERKYALALCQKKPQSKDDLELRAIYTEKGNTLVLYYYKGNRTFKKRLNVATKKLW